MIQFYEQGESRMSGSTEITISQSVIDENDPSKVAVRLKLDVGRVWSRVLKLFDLDSSYKVETASVVATVRGTSFDVQKTEDGLTEIWVAESSVTLEGAGEEGEGSGGSFDLVTTTSRSETDYDQFGREQSFKETSALPEGQSIVLDTLGRVMALKEIDDTTRQRPWFRDNQRADTDFASQIRDTRKAKLKKLGGARPDSFFAGLYRMSERMHLAAVREEDRDRRASRYFARRLALIIELVENGKAGLAAQELARLENYIKEELGGPEGEHERKRLRRALHDVFILVEDADPDSPLFQFKQRMEDLALALSGEARLEIIYVRLLSLDARLDEAAELIRNGRQEQARMALNAVRNGAENIGRDIQPLLNEFNKAETRSLTLKLSAIRAREGALRRTLEVPVVTDLPAATSTEPVAPTSTEPVPPPSEPPPTVSTPPPAAMPLYSRIDLFIQPNPIDVGAVSNLIVMGTKKDGTGQTDLSALSTFTITSGAGSLDGPTIQATTQGTVTVRATYNDAGTSLTASNTLTVQGMPTLQSLILSSSGGTTLTRGKSTQIISKAHYSNGYDKDVTNLTTFTNLVPESGTLNGSFFTPSPNFYGTTQIEGTFTENGVTVRSTITLTIN
jgi:hypothetical protein